MRGYRQGVRRTGVLRTTGGLLALAVLTTGCSAGDDPGGPASGGSTAAAGSSATTGGAAGTGSTGGTGGPAGTLVIRVRVGEQCPHEPATPDPRCSPVPLPATEVTVLDADGDVVAEGESAGSGTLRLAVPPGSYTVRGANLPDYLLTPSQPATVTAGAAVEVLLTYGNGIQ
jgi:hypothetical protein